VTTIQSAATVSATPAYTYDPISQTNVLADGTSVTANRQAAWETAATTSTAGSKTHFDD
jgi:putative ATP-grasp target RiPP